jgi:hypothetical protein
MLADVMRRVFKAELFYSQQRSAFEKETARVGAAKYRLDHKEEVNEVLDDLQQQVNARAVTALETLLSAFVEDVLPEHRREIKAEVGISRGVPALKFMAVDGDGNKESILDGNGGSVTNIVCAGLRMIALVKSHARPFMVLDEGDCWLKPERVDAFYQVLFRVARDLGVQLVVISHHDFSTLRHLGAFDIEFRAVGDQVEASYAPIAVEGHAHFRRLRLENYRSHISTDIPLHPEITVIHGDNSIGKSAIVDALRAVCYGEAAEDSIRHGCEACTVEIETEEGVLSWTRQRKGSPREMFEISQDGAVAHRGPGMRGGIPEFAARFLRIEKKDGLDIHLTHQKAPVFLLNLPASQQAAILSVGAEAGYVPRMIEAHKEMCRKDRDVVKKGEEFLAKTEREVLEPMAWVEKAEEIEARFKALETQATASAEALADAERLVERMERLAAFIASSPEMIVPGVPVLRDALAAERLLADMAACEPVSRVLAIDSGSSHRLPWPDTGDADRLAREWAAAALPASIHPVDGVEPISLHDVGDGERLVKEMGSLGAISFAQAPAVPSTPALVDEDGIIELGKTWAMAQRLAHQVGSVHTPAAPSMLDEAHVVDLYRSIENEQKGIGQSEKELAALLREMERVERDKNLILEQTGGACPVCNSLLKEHRKCA